MEAKREIDDKASKKLPDDKPSKAAEVVQKDVGPAFVNDIGVVQAAKVEDKPQEIAKGDK